MIELTSFWIRLQDRVDRFDVHVGKVAFYVAVLLYLAFLWTDARDFGGSNLPIVVIYVTALLSLLGLVSHVAFAKGYVDNPYSNEEIYEIEEAVEDTDESESDGISPVVFAKTILTILFFTVLIPITGFFSASFIFCFSFIFDRTRNVGKSALAATVLTLIFYVLFIVILENYLLVRLGIIDSYVFDALLS